LPSPGADPDAYATIPVARSGRRARGLPSGHHAARSPTHGVVSSSRSRRATQNSATSAANRWPVAWAQRLLARGARVRLAETGLAEWAERELLRRDPGAVLHAAAALGLHS